MRIDARFLGVLNIAHSHDRFPAIRHMAYLCMNSFPSADTAGLLGKLTSLACSMISSRSIFSWLHPSPNGRLPYSIWYRTPPTDHTSTCKLPGAGAQPHTVVLTAANTALQLELMTGLSTCSSVPCKLSATEWYCPCSDGASPRSSSAMLVGKDSSGQGTIGTRLLPCWR